MQTVIMFCIYKELQSCQDNRDRPCHALCSGLKEFHMECQIHVLISKPCLFRVQRYRSGSVFECSRRRSYINASLLYNSSHCFTVRCDARFKRLQIIEYVIASSKVVVILHCLQRLVNYHRQSDTRTSAKLTHGVVLFYRSVFCCVSQARENRENQRL